MSYTRQVKIIIGGDVSPSEMDVDLFRRGSLEELVGSDLADIITKADIRVYNLECSCISAETKEIAKQGEILSCDKETLEGCITSLNPSLFLLANNHIMDLGAQGLSNVRKILKDYNVKSVGAGKNLAEARRPFFLKVQNIIIGFYSCTQHEFSGASEDSCGANEYEPVKTEDDIKRIRERCDFLIVAYHGGAEYYPYPSPYLKKVCHRISDAGADLILCNHSHCIGCREIYAGSEILYGQGNFIFYGNTLQSKTGLLIQIELEKNSEKIEKNIHYIPCINVGSGIRLEKENDYQMTMNGFSLRSRECLDNHFLENEFSYFVRKTFPTYWNYFQNNINRLDLLNFIRCEAHREVLIRGALRTRYPVTGNHPFFLYSDEIVFEISRYERVWIVGAGRFGKAVCKWMISRNISPEGFLVSNLKNNPSSVVISSGVYAVLDFQNVSVSRDDFIMIAVNDEWKMDLFIRLRESGYCHLYTMSDVIFARIADEMERSPII